MGGLGRRAASAVSTTSLVLRGQYVVLVLENTFSSTGRSCHRAWISSLPFSACRASWMLSKRSRSWPEMNFASWGSPVQVLTSTTSRD